MAKREEKQCIVDVRFGRTGDGYISFPDLQDKIDINCGDYSPERCDAFIAEVTRRVRLSWQHMADRHREGR